MTLQRRDFLRTATTGLAFGFGFAGSGEALAQSSAGELRAGSGTLYLEGHLKAGLLKLEAQDLVDRADRAVIIRGSLGSTELYSAMFNYEKDSTIFALFNDSGHSTTMVLSNLDDPKIGHLVVWNDTDTPRVFSVDKATIMAANDPKDIVDTTGNIPDFVGKRKPPPFTWRELEKVFGSDPALLAFMRGERSTHHPREDKKLLDWICKCLSLVPGSLLSLTWEVLS